MSLSARRAWIEIRHRLFCRYPARVALRKESVDRNINCNSNFTQKKHVALRKESVDRNILALGRGLFLIMSLSARRAWIEILRLITLLKVFSVALRKESVDRNAEDWLNAGSLPRSLSARRAWIEILNRRFRAIQNPVALRKESVDRNSKINTRGRIKMGRSPQGERG